MNKKYFIKTVTSPEMITCPVCNGAKTIKADIVSKEHNLDIKNKDISCPNCNGTGEIATGKINHYQIGTVVLYGTAEVTDGDESGKFMLGFVCDDDSMIEKFKEQNNITDFVSYPNALSFYLENEETVLYNTLEEAQVALADKEANYTEPELTLVDNSK